MDIVTCEETEEAHAWYEWKIVTEDGATEAQRECQDCDVRLRFDLDALLVAALKRMARDEENG